MLDLPAPLLLFPLLAVRLTLAPSTFLHVASVWPSSEAVESIFRYPLSHDTAVLLIDLRSINNRSAVERPARAARVRKRIGHSSGLPYGARMTTGSCAPAAGGRLIGNLALSDSREVVSHFTDLMQREREQAQEAYVPSRQVCQKERKRKRSKFHPGRGYASLM